MRISVWQRLCCSVLLDLRIFAACDELRGRLEIAAHC
jgi:hypothetical protein